MPLSLGTIYYNPSNESYFSKVSIGELHGTAEISREAVEFSGLSVDNSSAEHLIIDYIEHNLERCRSLLQAGSVIGINAADLETTEEK